MKTVIDEIPDVRTLASKEVEYLVPDLIPKGTVTVISGESMAGKTTLSLWLCDGISQGKEILGSPCEQHPVLYLPRENPVEFIADNWKSGRLYPPLRTSWPPWRDASKRRSS